MIPRAYETGTCVFRGHSYSCETGVFIPRPETELLVDVALQFRPEIILELGSGTGVISIELSREFTDADVYSWDINPKAFALAKKNDALSRVRFFLGDFFEAESIWRPLMDREVLFVSNPPYIPAGDIPTLDTSVKDFEPHTALDGGPDGLDYYRKLLTLFSTFKKRPSMVFEIGIYQKKPLEKLLADLKYPDYKFFRDDQDIPRILKISN